MKVGLLQKVKEATQCHFLYDGLWDDELEEE